MPTTKIELGLLRTRHEDRSDNSELSAGKNSASKKMNRINSIKSFWSSNLSLASSSSSSSSQNNIKSNNFISSSKKLFRDLLTRSPSPSIDSERRKAFLMRSQTMKPSERRKIFQNRSSSRNLDRPTLNQTMPNEQEMNSLSRSTPTQVITGSNNIYDKLFVNQKLNAENTKLIKQIDNELSPYCHIYKDFTVDCLKPFFQIEKIEKIQITNEDDASNRSNNDHDDDHSIATESSRSKSFNSSSVDEKMIEQSSLQQTSSESCKIKVISTLNNCIYTCDNESMDEHNSPSTSLCLSSSSSNSLILKTEIVATTSSACEEITTANIDGPKTSQLIPTPQPRSIYLTYDYKRSQRVMMKKSKNKETISIYQNDKQSEKKVSNDHETKESGSTFRSQTDLIIPSSSSCSSSNSSSPTKFNAQFTDSADNSPQMIYHTKLETSAFSAVNSQTTLLKSSPMTHRKLKAELFMTANSISTVASSSSRTTSSTSSSCNPSTSEILQIKPNAKTNAIEKKSDIEQDYECIRDDELEKKRIAKGRIIDELVQTEMDYYKVMKLLYDVYLGANSENTIEQSQKEAIFCNLHEIMNLSSVMLNDFETYILNRTFEEVNIGKCFLKNANEIKKTYSYFTQYIEYSNNILEKNEKVVEVQRFIQNGLNIIKQQTTSAFDLHSLLLKPIQRVLKYPLLLQELIKNTEPCHEDFENLNQALTAMQHVAMYINEIKRRRELIVKYGRKDKDQSTITDKMSKFTMHSVIKKSNRISMKLSNAFGMGAQTIDEEFDKLENKFHYYEKLIKSFNKDSLQHLTNLKEFFKIQTVTSESIQEFYGEYESNEILQYVRINATVLNEIYTKNLNFVHEKVLRPLNSLLKLLDIPNKLITKRHDKLLDYECARAASDKNKDKNLAKAVQENLYECQKNYEALNNQLLEELPNLIEKCSYIFDKCFKLYLIALKNIHEKVQSQLKNLINPNQKSFKNISQSVNTSDPIRPSDSKLPPVMSRRNDKISLDNIKKKRSEFSIKIPKMIKSFGNSSDSANAIPKPTDPIVSTNVTKVPQTDHIKNMIKRKYKPEDIYKVNEEFTGYGVSGDINVNMNDIVGVIKKSDPCGNPTKWFVDNGYVKGIISAIILDPFIDDSIAYQPVEKTPIIEKDQTETQANNIEEDVDAKQSVNLSRKDSIGSFDENNDNHEYVNSHQNVTFAKKSEYCRVLYSFESIDETTMGVHEGENLKILQKHDDNLNDEWWLLEKVFSSGTEIHQDTVIRGYVPSNYVQPIYRAEIKSNQSDLIVLYND